MPVTTRGSPGAGPTPDRSADDGWRAMRRKHKRKKLRPAELTEDRILAWADAYHKLTGRWPTQTGSLPRTVPGAPAERWTALDLALRRGYRGLPGGSSLAQLLAARR